MDAACLVPVVQEIAAAVELHAGELEALALLRSTADLAECLFCSADGAALTAAAVLGLEVASLEELLIANGIKRALDYKYTRAFAKTHIQAGSSIRLYRM